MELDHVVVANSARIPCTIRTLRPFYITEDKLKPFVHSGEISDALLYLASRAGLPVGEIHALKELLENLSSSLKNLSDTLVPARDRNINTDEQQNQNTPAGNS